jgi:hypothetical protein
VSRQPVGERPGGGDPVVDADLELLVDGVPAHLTASGSTLTLRTEDAWHLWRSLPVLPTTRHAGRWQRRPRGLTVVGGVAEALAGQGLRLEVVDRHGTVASLGARTSSVRGKVLTGSRAVSVPLRFSLVRRVGQALAIGRRSSR